jgi:flagellar FliL protein
MLKLKLGKKKDAAPGGDDANLPAVSDGEGGEGAPAKKKLPLLFIIIPAALVVLGGGGAAAFFLMKPKPAEAEAAAGDHGKAEKKDEKADKKKGGDHGGGAEGEGDPAAMGTISSGPDGVTFYTLPDLIVNIQTADGRPTYLKLKLTLEMKDADLATHLQGEMPRMQDMFQGFLRELRPEDMAGSAGVYQLKVEILRRVNLIAAPGKVDAVLIEEMLVS